MSDDIDRLTTLLQALLAARSALREAEQLLVCVYMDHTEFIDNREGDFVNVELAAVRMCGAVAAIDAAIGDVQ